MSNLTMIYAKRLHRMFLSQDSDYKRGYLETCKAKEFVGPYEFRKGSVLDGRKNS